MGQRLGRRGLNGPGTRTSSRAAPGPKMGTSSPRRPEDGHRAEDTHQAEDPRQLAAAPGLPGGVIRRDQIPQSPGPMAISVA